MAKTDRRLGLHLFLVLLAGAVLTAPYWGPVVGSKFAWLEVDRVEVAGAHLIAPHEVFDASGVHPGRHILDNVGPMEAALRLHPVIADARVTRAFPRTLLVRIEEKVPVALVSNGSLVPATEAGEVLPIDPSAVSLDLPIVRGNMKDSVQAISIRHVLSETARLSKLDPALLSEISEIGIAPEGGDVLVLLHEYGEILLPFGASEARLEHLRAVLNDLGARLPASSGGGSAHPVIDLRYDGQVVVRHLPTNELS